MTRIPRSAAKFLQRLQRTRSGSATCVNSCKEGALCSFTFPRTSHRPAKPANAWPYGSRIDQGEYFYMQSKCPVRNGFRPGTAEHLAGISLSTGGFHMHAADRGGVCVRQAIAAKCSPIGPRAPPSKARRTLSCPHSAKKTVFPLLAAMTATTGTIP